MLVRIGAEVQEVPRGLTRSRRGDLVRLFIVSGLAVAVVTAVAAVRIWQQGDQDEQRRADAIVVLGAAQYDGRPSPVFEARLDHAVQLWKSGIADSFVVTGGKLPGDRTTEAAVARKYALNHDVPDGSIWGENEAHNTLDSLRAVAAEMKQRGLKSAVFVSDPTHMLRVLRIAHDLGHRGVRVAHAHLPGGAGPRSPAVGDGPRAGRARGVLRHRRGAGGGAARELTSGSAGDGRATLSGRPFNATQISARNSGPTPWREREPTLYSGSVLRPPGIGVAQPIAPCPSPDAASHPSRSIDSEG